MVFVPVPNVIIQGLSGHLERNELVVARIKNNRAISADKTSLLPEMIHT